MRKDYRKFEPRGFGRNSFKKSHKPFTNNSERADKEKKFDKNKERNRDRKPSENSNRDRHEKNERNFDKRRKVTCYLCGEPNHIRPNCPKLLEKSHVNHINLKEKLGDEFEPYIHKAVINGKLREYLKDSGTLIDICEASMVNIDDILPENVWVKQPLDESCKSLPLAKIVIEGDFGVVVTKAAIRPSNLDQNLYLMGNYTSKLIEEASKKINHVNAVQTRNMSRAKREREENPPLKRSREARTKRMRERNLTVIR